jgi:hypothetical protein
MTAQEILAHWPSLGTGDLLRNGTSRYSLRFSASLVFLCCVFTGGTTAHAQQSADADKQAKIAALKAELDATTQKVKVIVNQPVTALRRIQGMRVTTFKEGWFHEGAVKPAFGHVDVRRSQQLPYEKYPYVTSDLNPGVVFIGRQLEFNAMTKYFYTDRSLPKKKLTEAEMVEINRLYEIIGRCEQQLDELERQHGFDAEGGQEKGKLTLKFDRIPKSNYVKGAIGIAIVLVLYLAYRKFRVRRG